MTYILDYSKGTFIFLFFSPMIKKRTDASIFLFPDLIVVPRKKIFQHEFFFFQFHYLPLHL